MISQFDVVLILVSGEIRPVSVIEFRHSTRMRLKKRYCLNESSATFATRESASSV
jgi:hypothetical protein